RYGAEAEQRGREDIRRQLEQERILADARRSTQPPAGKVSMSELRDNLQRLSPEEIEALWGFLVPALKERVRRGEVSREHAMALQDLIADFDRARVLPDLEARTVEMNKVMARLKAILT